MISSRAAAKAGRKANVSAIPPVLPMWRKWTRALARRPPAGGSDVCSWGASGCFDMASSFAPG